MYEGAMEPKIRTNYSPLILALCMLVSGYPRFQMEIPNGDSVPHPCDVTTRFWHGVGHRNHLGGGSRNPFGLAFEKNEYKWTVLLCRADSDEDGLTNGEELGDPDCLWSKGLEVAGRATSHPGICEPLEDPKCSGRNEFVYCARLDFECDALIEPDIFNITVQIPKTGVPPRTTTYMCMDFEFPFEREHHLVATTPAIDNQEVMHHLLLFLCPGDHDMPLNTTYQCGESATLKCQNLIAIWQIGFQGECHRSDVGIVVGGPKKHRYATFQFHWNNPREVPDMVDGSGLTFFLTPILRPHNASYWYFGPRYLEIPAHTDQHTVSGTLKGDCTSMLLKAPIHVTSMTSHMHFLGHAQKTYLSRDGELVNVLAEDDPFTWDYIVSHRFDESVVIQPGDELTTACTFKSTDKSVTTFWGEEAMDEMCFAFMVYYPDDNFRVSQAITWGDIGFCDIINKEFRGCDLTTHTNANHSISLRRNVNTYCRPGICLPECLNFVRGLKKGHCYHGDANQLLRNPYGPMTMEEKFNHARLYAAIDSCDVQLALESKLPYLSVATLNNVTTYFIIFIALLPIL